MPATLSKIDLKKEMKQLYTAPIGRVVELNVPAMRYLMIDGKGDPNTSADFQNGVQALYSTAYTLKFSVKKQLHKDYVVLPLEGLWWVGDGQCFNQENKDSYCWTLMILQPDFITKDLFQSAVADVRAKKQLPGIERIRLERLAEGRCIQTMHIGPYSAEEPTIALLHRHAEEHGCRLTGKHHEIYMGDPRRTAPERLKTIIRQPVR